MKTQLTATCNRAAQWFLFAVITVTLACSEKSVTDPPADATYTLSATPANLSVLRGGRGEFKITAVRTGGFNQFIGLTVSGAPEGVTAAIDASASTPSVVVILVTTTSSASIGNFTLTITGTSTGQDPKTVTMPIVLIPSPGGAGNVTVDFSNCDASGKPIWFSYQDGSNAWTEIIGAGDVYRFNVASAKGGYAWVHAPGGGVTANLNTRAELEAGTIFPCGTSQTYKTLSGTLAGMITTEAAFIGIGGGYADSDDGSVPGPNFTLSGVQAGSQDLIAYRFNTAARGINERAIIRRDQNIPDKGTVAKLDFSASESFAPVSAALTVTGDGAATSRHWMTYGVGPSCFESFLYDDPRSWTAGMSLRGIPPAQQLPTDFHRIAVYTENQDRFAFESFHTLAARTVALPPVLTAPTVTAIAGGHKRVQANFTLQSEYQKDLWFVYSERFPPNRGVIIYATYGWAGTSTPTIITPDFSQTTGWRSQFLPPTTSLVSWWAYAAGVNAAGAAGNCAENARFVYATRQGTSDI